MGACDARAEEPGGPRCFCPGCFEEKVEKQGQEDAKLWEQMQCNCKKTRKRLDESIQQEETRLPMLRSERMGLSAQKARLEARLEAEKERCENAVAEKADAQAALTAASELRQKEANEFEKLKEELQKNVAAVGKAIAAFEKGLAGTESESLLFATEKTSNLRLSDREALTALLSGEAGAPGSSAVLGALQSMRDTMEEDSREAQAVLAFQGMAAARRSEVSTLDTEIETKTSRIGELSVDLVNQQQAIDSGAKRLQDETKLLSDTEESCQQQEQERWMPEWHARSESRAEELVAIQETLKLLADDELSLPLSPAFTATFSRASSSGMTTQDIYISSIPLFVEACEIFVVLVPAAYHTTTQWPGDPNGWSELSRCLDSLSSEQFVRFCEQLRKLPSTAPGPGAELSARLAQRVANALEEVEHKTETVSASLLLLLQRCLGSLEHSQLEQLQLQQRLLPALKRSRSLASSAQAMVCLQRLAEEKSSMGSAELAAAVLAALQLCSEVVLQRSSRAMLREAVQLLQALPQVLEVTGDTLEASALTALAHLQPLAVLGAPYVLPRRTAAEVSGRAEVSSSVSWSETEPQSAAERKGKGRGEGKDAVTALQTLQAQCRSLSLRNFAQLFKLWPKAFFGRWPLVLDFQSGEVCRPGSGIQRPMLLSICDRDPVVRVRQQALKAQSSTSLTGQLAMTIRQSHALVMELMDGDELNQLNALRACADLVASTPYSKLQSGLITSLLDKLLAFAYQSELKLEASPPVLALVLALSSLLKREDCAAEITKALFRTRRPSGPSAVAACAGEASAEPGPEDWLFQQMLRLMTETPEMKPQTPTGARRTDGRKDRGKRPETPEEPLMIQEFALLTGRLALFVPAALPESTLTLLEQLVLSFVSQQSSMLRLRAFRLLNDLPLSEAWQFSPSFLEQLFQISQRPEPIASVRQSLLSALPGLVRCSARSELTEEHPLRQVLRQGLQDVNGGVRTAAAQALGAMASRFELDAVQWLIPLAADPTGDVRSASATALASFAPRLGEGPLRTEAGGGWGGAERVSEHPCDVIPPPPRVSPLRTAAVAQPPPKCQWNACRSAGQLAVCASHLPQVIQELMDALCELLGTENLKVRIQAVVALQQVTVVSDQKEVIKVAAEKALSRISCTPPPGQGDVSAGGLGPVARWAMRSESVRVFLKEAEKRAEVTLLAMSDEERYSLMQGIGWIGLPTWLPSPLPAIPKIGYYMGNTPPIPRLGRNFEYILGEDPYLGAKMSEAYVVGVQGEGVMACLKHFGFNEQETNRNFQSSVVDEKTAWELYYPPFEAGVAAGAASVMCSYNRVNGTHSCANEALLRRDLKQKMGFRGFVMTDWWALHHPADSSVVRGLDMEMPGAGGETYLYKGDLRTMEESQAGNFTGYGLGLEKSKLQREIYNDPAYRILSAAYKLHLFDLPSCTPGLDCVEPIFSNQRSLEAEKLAMRCASESVVLLKNEPRTGETKALPLLPSKVKKLALIGEAWVAPSRSTNELGMMGDYYSGGGSGHCYIPPELFTLPIVSMYERANSLGIDISSALTNNITDAMNGIKDADAIVVLAATTAEESRDRASLHLDNGADDLIFELAKQEKPVIVLTQVPGTILLPWKDNVDAIALMFLGIFGVSSRSR
eukprot:g20418.t1